MPKGLVVPADTEQPLELRQFDDFTEYQRAVDGTFDVIELTNPESSLYLNDEGKLKGLPANFRATLLLWAHNSAFRHRDFTCGDVVLLGGVDDEGDTLDVPDQLVELLTKTSRFKTQVQTGGDDWAGNGMTFDTWTSAYNAVLDLAGRWLLVTEVRVIPA